MSRTTAEFVRATLQSDPTIDVEPAIRTATRLMDYVVSQDSLGLLTSDLQVEIETYLAAHFYSLRDQQFESKNTGDASAKFQTAPKQQGLLATDWGQQAVALDVSGTLKLLATGTTKVGMHWLGKSIPQQIDYWDRN